MGGGHRTVTKGLGTVTGEAKSIQRLILTK